MKPKEIQELLDFISQSGLAEVNIETEQFKLSVKKHAAAAAQHRHETPIQQFTAPQPVAHPVPPITTPVQEKTEKTTDASKENKYLTIKSPMIGTFYRSSNPETQNFVNVGDEISAGQTVCIIEAMKLFNEIESEISGKIVKILVENASPVEYDQPLFLVEPK
jgi:acetyl-CoA carboxylase biotin carboxyl carrier protein